MRLFDRARTKLGALRRPRAFDELVPAEVVRLAYNVMLRREPDPGAMSFLTEAVESGELTPADVVDRLRTSEEYRVRTPIRATSLLQSLHLSRMEFILGLPAARRIVDLGGSATYDSRGALVLLGYPHDFDELTVVDLPSDERHRLYQSDAPDGPVVHTELGPVSYHFGSMTDLSFAADGSVDLVFAGQSIEHVTPADARVVCREVLRVLRPGGFFALDTPNAEVCRLQTANLIDPDHKIEYTAEGLEALLASAGFDVVERKGLNLARRSVSSGGFDEAEVAANPGLFHEARACYILAFLARKPPAQIWSETAVGDS